MPMQEVKNCAPNRRQRTKLTRSRSIGRASAATPHPRGQRYAPRAGASSDSRYNMNIDRQLPREQWSDTGVRPDDRRRNERAQLTT